MKTNKMHVAMLAGGIGVALMLSGLAHAGDGSLMEVTTTIKQSMSGMPAMPSRTMTHKVCSAPGSFDPHALNKMNDAIASLALDAGADVVVLPETTRATADAVAGLMKEGGHPMTVDTEYTGKQIGTCDYKPPKTSD